MLTFSADVSKPCWKTAESLSPNKNIFCFKRKSGPSSTKIIVNTLLAKPKVPTKKKGGIHQPVLPWAVSGIQMHDYLWAKEEKKKDAEEKQKT